MLNHHYRIVLAEEKRREEKRREEKNHFTGFINELCILSSPDYFMSTSKNLFFHY